MTPEMRAKYWSRIEKKIVRQPDGCWIWQGGVTSPIKPYGVINFEGKARTVHRLAWEMINGPIPEGQIIMHRCDQSRCCNPEHLKIGTYQDNSDDMMAKGRGRFLKGEDHPFAKNPQLKAAAAERIRKLGVKGRKALREKRKDPAFRAMLREKLYASNKCKLNEQALVEIKKLLEQKVSMYKIASMYGVSQPAIYYIKSGKRRT